MAIPEARKYIEDLQKGIVKAQLNEEEKKIYDLYKENMGDESQNEEEYLIGALEARIMIAERSERERDWMNKN